MFLYCEGVSMVFLGVILVYVEDVRGFEFMELLIEELLEEEFELLIRVMRVFLMLFWLELGFN